MANLVTHLTPVVPRVSATTPPSFILALLLFSVSCQYGTVSCTSDHINLTLTSGHVIMLNAGSAVCSPQAAMTAGRAH